MTDCRRKNNESKPLKKSKEDICNPKEEFSIHARLEIRKALKADLSLRLNKPVEMSMPCDISAG
eukprot:6197827-Pleurochrysis_carterae.AAC.1